MVDTLVLLVMASERLLLTSETSLESMGISTIAILVSADSDIRMVLLATESVVGTRSQNDHQHQRGLHCKCPNHFFKPAGVNDSASSWALNLHLLLYQHPPARPVYGGRSLWCHAFRGMHT